MSKLRIGIIGSGFMGRTHAEVVSRYCQNASLAAIAGGRNAVSLAADYQATAYPSAEAMLEQAGVDAVIVTTPHTSHAALGCLAAAHGKHALVEKPLGTSLEECDRLIRACREAGVNLMTAQTQRYREGNRVAKALIEAGRIGKISMVEEVQHSPRPDDLVDRKETCGRLLGHGIHSPDRLRWFLGDEVEWVAGFSRNYYIDSPHENSSMTLLQFYQGAMATLWVTFESSRPTFPKSAFHARIIGEQGTLDVDSFGQVLLGTEKGWEVVFEQRPFDFQKEPLSPIRLESFTRQDQEFIDSILEQRSPAVSGEDGRAAVEIVLAAYESQRTRQVVRLGR